MKKETKNEENKDGIQHRKKTVVIIIEEKQYKDKFWNKRMKKLPKDWERSTKDNYYCYYLLKGVILV